MNIKFTFGLLFILLLTSCTPQSQTPTCYKTILTINESGPVYYQLCIGDK